MTAVAVPSNTESMAALSEWGSWGCQLLCVSAQVGLTGIPLRMVKPSLGWRASVLRTRAVTVWPVIVSPGDRLRGEWR